MTRHAAFGLLMLATLGPALAQDARRTDGAPVQSVAFDARTPEVAPPGPGLPPDSSSPDWPGQGFGPGPGRRLRGGGRRGGMMGDGGFGSPWAPVRRWQDVDRRLQECRRKHEEIETRRQKSLNDLVAAKKDYHPEQINPAAVLARANLDKILAALHETVEQERTNSEEAGEVLASALLTRNIWEPLVRQNSPQNEASPQSAAEMKARQAAWLKGLERLDKDGPEGFARELLGDTFGQIAFQAIPDRLKRPGILMFRPGDMGGAGRMRGQLLENIRENWLGRIERMERRQEELERELERQSREIEQMRLIMDNVLSDPGSEGKPALNGTPKAAAKQQPPTPGKPAAP